MRRNALPLKFVDVSLSSFLETKAIQISLIISTCSHSQVNSSFLGQNNRHASHNCTERLVFCRYRHETLSLKVDCK